MVRIPEGEGALIRAGPRSTVNKHASLETKRGVTEDHRTKQDGQKHCLIHWVEATWPLL
jgi:hypothetical protein